MIHLAGDYYLSADSKNFILNVKKIRGEKSKTPGKVVYKEIGFYGKLLHLLDGLAKHMALDLLTSDELTTINTLRRRLIDIEETLAGMDIARFNKM